jgi:hypothetical protein
MVVVMTNYLEIIVHTVMFVGNLKLHTANEVCNNVSMFDNHFLNIGLLLNLFTHKFVLMLHML